LLLIFPFNFNFFFNFDFCFNFIFSSLPFWLRPAPWQPCVSPRPLLSRRRRPQRGSRLASEELENQTNCPILLFPPHFRCKIPLSTRVALTAPRSSPLIAHPSTPGDGGRAGAGGRSTPYLHAAITTSPSLRDGHREQDRQQHPNLPGRPFLGGQAAKWSLKMGGTAKSQPAAQGCPERSEGEGGAAEANKEFKRETIKTSTPLK